MGNPLIPLNSFQNGLLGGGGEGMHGLGVLYFAYHMFSLACFVPTSANGVALASLSRRTLDVGAAVTWQAALRFSSAYCALPLLVLLAWAAAHDWLLPFAPEFMLGKVPVATFFLMAAVLSTLQVPAHLYLIAHHRLGRVSAATALWAVTLITGAVLCRMGGGELEVASAVFFASYVVRAVVLLRASRWVAAGGL
jgi:hypothetical protein